jgi:hypothetical protein
MSRFIKNWWAIGIDPGLGETGLVLRPADERNKVIAWAVLSCPPNGSGLERTRDLAAAVMGVLDDWVWQHMLDPWSEPEIEAALDIGIETPIYNGNARSFELQWRLVAALEESIGRTLAEVLSKVWITEVPPSTSKQLAGKGFTTKDQVFGASPFPGMRADGKLSIALSKDTYQTLSDAWAHSLATWEGCKKCQRVDMGDWGKSKVTIVERGPAA